MADIAPDRSTTAVLALGRSIDSAIDSDGDVDLIRVDLVAGRSYSFDLLGASSGLGLADPTLTLLDADLATLAYDDDGGTGLDAQIGFTAMTSGTHYLRAAGLGGTGSYRLAMASAERSDDYGQSAGGAGALAIGGSGGGAIDHAGDRDWFRIDLAAGQSYAFSVNGAARGHGTLADPLLVLYAADGALVATNDDGPDGTLDPLLDFTPAAGGSYYLEVSGFGDGTGSYRVSAAATGSDAGESALVAGGGGGAAPGGAAAGDHVFATAGDDLLIGGRGSDTVTYAGMARSYQRALAGGSGTITGGPEGGTDTLSSIETVAFADGYFTSDPNSHAAQVARLYHLVLERAPDTMGLNDWVHMLEHGSSLAAVADGFAASAEFQARTAGLSNADFVEFLYNGALGRASDPDGKAAWTGAIDSGAISRGQAIVGFSESIEYHGLIDGALGPGFFIYDETHAAIASLYDAFADRAPDLAGLQSWVALADSGEATMLQIAGGFAGSEEFHRSLAGLDERGIVEMLYRNVLDREGEPAGVAAWTETLQATHDVGSLLWDFARSTEHQVLMQAALADGILYL